MGQARECRVHDLMREGKARHLSLYDRANNNFPGSSSKSQVHSIIAFQVDFKFLKEVDFAGVPLSYVSEELWDLLHLRYSSLRYTKVKMLPESIGKLHNLQSLDLKRSPVHELPAEGNKLYNLQYLAAYYTSCDKNSNIYSRKEVKVSNSFANLNSLEKLLKSSKLKPKHGVAFFTAIEQMNKLQSLSITSIKDEVFLQLQSMSYPPVSLRKLCLRGRLTKLPNWVPKLHNLVRIGLHWSRIFDDSLKLLGVLPKLLKFQLTNGIRWSPTAF
ncbi:Disease resistance protein [Gossypium australe]|uniref:Disease resistance protein n=1 Tax=Gossypium australe TaxID=47621 RepID=A0A5B6UMG8_9ROSI|nr:Disease resistance protein [Gossypium australe]